MATADRCVWQDFMIVTICAQSERLISYESVVRADALIGLAGLRPDLPLTYVTLLALYALLIMISECQHKSG